MVGSYLRVPVGAGFLFLAACGGGGGTSLVSSPPPPAAPTSFPLTTSGSFQTISGVLTYNWPANSGPNTFAVTGRGSGVTFSYDAGTGSYTVQDSVASATFNSADRGQSPNSYMDEYSKSGTTADDYLEIYNNIRSGTSQASAPVQLTYLSYGDWSHSLASVGENRVSYFLFGYPTTTSEMPRTGTASYQTAVTARSMDNYINVAVSPLTGTATFTADFANATVDTALTLPLGLSPTTYNGTGAISGNQFSGDFTSANDPYFGGGSFAGGFFGPNAQEMGYTFKIKTGSPDPYAGASVAPVLSWTVGAVVGTKK